MEREQIRQRQREGIKIAKAQGKYTGRKPLPIDRTRSIKAALDDVCGDLARSSSGIGMEHCIAALQNHQHMLSAGDSLLGNIDEKYLAEWAPEKLGVT